MYHPNHFDKHLVNISLDESRANRIAAAIRGFQNFLNNDKLNELATGDPYFQGSYAYDTVTRPLADETEYDVDLVLPLDVNRRPEGRRNPDQVLEYVKSRLDTYAPYQGKVRTRRVCVRVVFSGLFHLDLVPAHQPSGPGQELLIPNRESNAWERSTLQEYTTWFKRQNAGRAQFRLTRTVKMLKRWRDLTFGEGRGPPSIILTTLAGAYNPASWHDRMPFPSAYAQDPNDASFLLDTVKLNHHLLSPLKGPIKLPNPVDGNENLAARWSGDDYDLFVKRLTTLMSRVQKAYDCRERERSIDLWQEALDGFPRHP